MLVRFICFTLLFLVVTASECEAFFNSTHNTDLLTPEAQPLFDDLIFHKGECGGHCNFADGFSCVTFDYDVYAFQLSNCTRDIFPLCMGRLEVTNNCETLKCCQQLNEREIEEVDDIVK